MRLRELVKIYFCKRKSQVKDKLVEFIAFVKLHGGKTEEIGSDGGGEYTGTENAIRLSMFEQICIENGIRQITTAPYTPAMNGISERLNRTISEAATCMLHDACLDNQFWSLAVAHACYVKNRLPHRSLIGDNKKPISPYEKLHGVPPRLKMVRVFGCDAWRVMSGNQKKDRLLPRSVRGIHVGMSANKKAWLVFDPETRKLYATHHCSFNEDFGDRRDALTLYKRRKTRRTTSTSELATILFAAELFQENDSRTDVFSCKDVTHLEDFRVVTPGTDGFDAARCRCISQLE